jgi:hypothetical protein
LHFGQVSGCLHAVYDSMIKQDSAPIIRSMMLVKYDLPWTRLVWRPKFPPTPGSSDALHCDVFFDDGT